MNHLQTFESFNENKLTDIARNIGHKVGVIKMNDEEIEKKAKAILQDEEKLLNAIKSSSNPRLHMSNYDNLKNGDNKLPFYKFVIFLNDNISDLVNKRPLYYQITDFGIVDTRVQPEMLSR